MGWRDVQRVGHFLQRQQSGLAQTIIARLEAVAAHQTRNQMRMEGFAGTGDDAAFVQDGGDLRDGLFVKQLVDLIDHRRGRDPLLPGLQRQGQIERLVRATFEADLQRKLMVPVQSYILEQKPNHAFALTVRRGGIPPQSGKV